jgi:phosphinothricin acetyltransferase
MSDVRIERANAADWEEVARLLELSKLPLAGAREHLASFRVAREGAAIVAVAGYEARGDAVLLRSFAVAPSHRGSRLGAMLLGRLESDAREAGARAAYLLTTTAGEYFIRHGFRRMPREDAPVALRESLEFRGACPASAVLLVKSLDGAAPARVRVATVGDAEAITSIYAPIVANTTISFELVPPSVDEMGSRIASTLDAYPWLVSLDDAGEVEGFVYAGRHRERPAYQWSVDVTAYVREDARGRGVGKRLYTALFDELRRLGYCQAFAGIALPNPASVALHEAVGFEPLGVYRNVGFKFGRWHDVGWWQKELQRPDRPEAPAAFGARKG